MNRLRSYFKSRITSKLVSIMLSISLLGTMLPVTASADEDAVVAASDIAIGTAAPANGAVVSDGTVTFAGGTAAVTWSSDGTSYAAASGTFAQSTVYRTKYVLTANTGYVFAPAAGVYQQGGASDLSGSIANLGSATFTAVVSTGFTLNDTLTIVVTWPNATIEPSDISIGTIAPATGAAIADGTNTFNKATAVIAWSDNGTTFGAAAGTFAPNTYYYAKYVITANAGYAFDTTSGIYKNGAKSLVGRIANLGTGLLSGATVSTVARPNDTLTVFVSWEMTDEAEVQGIIKATDITIGTAAPAPGAVVANGANVFNLANVVYVEWHKENPFAYLDEGEPFDSGTTYLTEYVLEATSGYAFDESSAYRKGGSRDLSSRIANLGTGTFTVSGSAEELSIMVTWPQTGLLLPSDISIGTQAPVAEATMADGTNAFGHATTAIGWSADNGGTYNPATGSYGFVTAYKTKYVITADTGYFFDATAGVYADGGAKSLKNRISNLGSGTFTAVVSGASNETLTIVVAWPQTAAAPFTTVDASGMSIGTAAPVSGATIANGTNAFPHTTASVTWSADNGASYAAASGTFAPGKAYKTKVVLTADSGYAFDPTAGAYGSVSIPNLGSGSVVAQVSTASTSNDTLTITITWPATSVATIAASELSIGTIAPVTGASMANGANTFPYATAGIEWSGDGGLSYAAASGTYAPHTVYKTKYVLTANGGYTFDSAMNAYNSVEVESLAGVALSAVVSTSATANDTLTIEIAWPATGAATIVPSDLSIGTVAPATGTTQANGTNAFAHATGDVTWSSDGGASYAAAGGTFAAAKVYRTKYVLTAMAGYAFNPTANVYEKNGASDLSGRIDNLGAGAFSAAVSSASSPNDTLTIVVTWPATGAATILPSDITIGTAAPVTGAIQSNGSNTFDHATASISWSADNGGTYQPAGGTYAIGKSYMTKYVLTAAANYRFSGSYGTIVIANLGSGTFTAQVSTTSAANDTLTIIVTWPATEITDSVKVNVNDAVNFRAYSGGTLIPAQGLTVNAAGNYSITLVNGSIDTTNPSAPPTAALVKGISVKDGLGNDVPTSVQILANESSGVAQHHPWSLQITIDKNETASARLVTVTVNTDIAQRIDIRNLIGFTNPTIDYAQSTPRSGYPYNYGNYFYFLPGDFLKMQTTSSSLIPAGVQLVGKNTSKTSPVTNTLLDTTNYRFGYTFSMPSEPIYLSVTSTDGKAAHNIAVNATIPGVVSPTLSGGSNFVQATVSKPATDYSGATITVDPGSYNTRLYKVRTVEARSDLLNVALPVTKDATNGTYSFVMPFTDANVTVVIEKIVSNKVQTEITTNANAEMTVDLEEYYPGDKLHVQILNKDPAKYVVNVQAIRVRSGATSFLVQGLPSNPYDSRIELDLSPYASTAQLTAGDTLRIVAKFESVSIPVTTASAAQFSNYPAKASLNEPITLSFSPPTDASKIYKPVVRYRDRLNNKTVSACTYVRSDPQDQTKSVYTCPAVTKNSIDLVELLYDSIDANAPAAGGAPGATKLRNIASVSPNSRLQGIFKSINVFGTNMNGQGQVYIGTEPNPTVAAAVTDVTATSLVVQVPDNMKSRTIDVTYYVSSNGVQRSVTIPAAENLSHAKFGYLAVVSDSQFNHSVVVSESEKDLTQQLGGRTAEMTIKGSFTANASMRGEYNFSGTTTINGGLAVYLPNAAQSLFNVRDDSDGTVKVTMEKVNMTAGSFSIMSTSDGSIRMDKGIEYIPEYARDEDGVLEDPSKRNIDISIRNQNKLTVVGSGMQAGITGATLLGNAVILDGRIYFGMALPGSNTVGIDLNIDRLQYGMDAQGNLSFQGVTADGSFTPGTDMSKQLLGGFGINGSAEGSIDTFNGKYGVAFDMDAKLANFASSLSLKKNGATGQFIPDSIKIIVGLGSGIPVTPMTPIAKLTRVGGGVSGLADTITGNYKGIAPILILLNGDFEVGSLVPGAGLLEFNDVELAIGPSQISLSGNPTLLKMEIFDRFQAGIYVTNSSVSYQMQIFANILKNFSVILAGGSANLTYYRNNGFNLNGQMRGKLQVPEIDVGLFSIGPYTLLDSDVGLSNSNAYASFSILGFGLKVDYSFGSGSVSVGRRSFASAPTGPTGQTVYDEDGEAVGQINAFSNVRIVASSGGSRNQLRALAVEPTISTNDEGTEHTVTFPAGLTDDYAVLVSADPDDLRIVAPDGSPYGLTYPETLEDGTPYYDDPNANAAVVSASTVMIRLGSQAGNWKITSSQPFDSSIIAIAPVPKIAGTSYDAGTHQVRWDLTGLDIATEDYQVEVRLATDNGDDPNARSAGVLVYTVDVANVSEKTASGSYTFTAQDLNYLQSGQYYARVTLIGKPIADASRSIPYASMNAKTAMNVVNPLAPGAIGGGVTVSAGGSGTIHAAWSAVSDADGYLVRLYDADGNAVMSPLTFTDEIGSDGNPTGNQVAHAGRPIEYQVSADDEKNGGFGLDFGGIESGNSYRLAVAPFAYADDAEMNSSYIYGATTVSDVVAVPLVKMPVIHAKPSAGVISNDSLLGNMLKVGGDFTLGLATTYVSADDGQTQDLDAKFTVWQSDGTIDEATAMPNYTLVYASDDYENQASVPIAVDGDAGSTMLRIVAENDQGDVSEYGLAVQYSSLPPALFVETGAEGKIVADSAGRYQIKGSTSPYATVLDNLGNRTTADDEGLFSMTGTLSAGTQAYRTITATDALGNFAQDDVSIVKSGASANPGTDPGANPGTNPGTGTGSGTSTDGGQTDGSEGAENPAKITFDDVNAQAPWAAAAIERAYEMGIVSGRAPGVFAPNSGTRRDEAIAMLARARQLTVGKQADLDAAAARFADWDKLAEWSKPYVAAAYANGLVTGTERDGKHYVNGASLVTRAEVAVLFQNAYRLAADAGNRKTFGDAIPSWASDSVDILSSNGVISGYPDSTFLPGSNATRAEIVVMLMRLIDRQEAEAPAEGSTID